MTTPGIGLLRRLTPAIMRILTAIAVCFSFTACPLIEAVLSAYFGLPAYEGSVISSISHTQLIRGETTEVVVTIPLDGNRAEFQTALLGEENRRLEEITFTQSQPSPTEFRLQVTVAPTVPLDPIYIYFQIRDRAPDFPSETNVIFYEYRPISIVASAGAMPPRIASVAPSEVPVDATTPIEITGENFTASSEVVLTTTPGVTFGATTFVSPTKLGVTVDAQLAARTGEATLFVRDGGVSSTRVPLLVADRSGRPVVSGAFPNHAVFGVSTPVVITGDNLEAGQRLVPNIPLSGAPEVTRQPEPRDRLNSVFLTTTRVSGLQTYTLESPRGNAAVVVPVRGISPTGLLKAFRITAIAGQVTPGTVGQLLVTVDQDPGVAPTPLHRPTELAGTVMDNLVAFPPSILGSGRKVLVHFEAAATPVLGPHYLAFQADFSGFPLTSNLFPFNFAAPRADAPLVRRTTNGQIARGQQNVVETIEGENLDGATALRFASAGLTATIPPGQTSSTQLQVLLSATADAELTGEVVTTFQVLTRTHGGSNHAGYLVLP